MQDARSVITQVTRGFVHKLAKRREVSEARMYEILGKDNPYPKAKIMIRDIAEVNPSGIAVIRADLEAMFHELESTGSDREISAVELHKEAFEAIDAVLQGKSAADQLRELRELQAVVEMKINGIQRLQERTGLREVV